MFPELASVGRDKSEHTGRQHRTVKVVVRFSIRRSACAGFRLCVSLPQLKSSTSD